MKRCFPNYENMEYGDSHQIFTKKYKFNQSKTYIMEQLYKCFIQNDINGLYCILLDDDIDLNFQDDDGNTLLIKLCQLNDVKSIKLLLDYEPKLNINMVNKYNQSAFTIAVMNNKIDLVQLLLTYDAKPNISNNKWEINYAFEHKYKKMLSFLLELPEYYNF